MWQGMTRVVTFVVFGVATFGLAPLYIYDSTQNSWMAPLIVIGSAVPMVVTVLIAAPFVSVLRLAIPKRSKSSLEDVMSFARSVPGSTRVTIQSMKGAPWPTKTVVRFDELRRLPPKKFSVANLMYLQSGKEKQDQRNDAAKRYPVTSGLAQRVFSRLYVDREQVIDKSSVPGILDLVWEQIPMLGEGPDDVVPQSAKPTTARVRTQLDYTRQRDRPPPAQSYKM